MTTPDKTIDARRITRYDRVADGTDQCRSGDATEWKPDTS
jgi:hypothetical protein